METIVLPPARPVAPPSHDAKTTVAAVVRPPKPAAAATPGVVIDTYA